MAGDDDDREKRSWRDLDRKRDRSPHTSGGRGSRERSEPYRNPRGQAEYKAKLERFWNSGELSKGVTERLGMVTPEQKRKDELLKAISSAETEAAFVAAVEAYAEALGMPEDPRVLDRLLGHPESALAPMALERLAEMHAAGALKVPASLPERLRTLELSDDPLMAEKAAALRKALR